MHIERLRLVDYRNYKDVSAVFSPGINVLYGGNGQGKTNLLEALFLMCRGYAHRAGGMREVVRFGAPALFAAAEIRSRGTRHRISLKAAGGKKGWKLDGSAVPGFLKIAPLTGCILFEPDDLDIVKGSPERRRRFMSQELAGLVPAYTPVLRAYERARHQRNALLRQYRKSPAPLCEMRAMFAVWDSQMSAAAGRIYQMRARYLSRLAPAAAALHAGLCAGDERLALAYRTNVFEGALPERPEEIAAAYREKLEAHLERDVFKGFTGPGPHADEIDITVNGHAARLYASQGQQRSAAISMKLAHIKLYKEDLELSPVVLLDDIFSELDQARRRGILSVLTDAQTFITGTNADVRTDMHAHAVEVKNGALIDKG